MLLNVFILCMGVLCVRAQETVPARTPSETYPYITNMDDQGDYILRWTFTDTIIRFQIQVRTLGYVAFGVSKEGQMVPADVVIGYVANGNVYFNDSHTVSYTPPVGDRSQDWNYEYGYEENGWTVLGFNRSLDTCDEDDMPITDGTMQLIYAYDALDPPSFSELFHHDKRGSKPVNLLTRSKPPRQFPNDLQLLEFRNENYTIPSDKPSSYYCRVFNLSHITQKYHAIQSFFSFQYTIPSDKPSSYYCRVFNLSHITQKYHAIQIAPVYSPETSFNIQHMFLYRCKITNPAVSVRSGEGSECFTDAPNHIQFCREYVAGFSQNADGMYFPNDVGLPIGGRDEPSLYVLAIHYENSDYVPGLVDNSGIQVTMTSQLRQHEGSFLTMGNIISQNWLQFIPPGEKKFLQRAYCPQRCLSRGFRRSGSATSMTVAGVQFHAHSLSSGMRIRHMTYTGRDMVRENPWIAEDKTFDAKDQSFRILKDRKRINYFDTLMLECTYDSRRRNRPTVGGWTSYDELCRAYVFYYPRKPIEGCMSWSNLDQLRSSTGQRLTGSNVFESLVATNWTTDTTMRRNLRRALDTSIELGLCWSSSLQTQNGIDYFPQPRITSPYFETSESPCRRLEPASRSVQMFG